MEGILEGHGDREPLRGFGEMHWSEPGMALPGLLLTDIVITNLTNVCGVLTAYQACQALMQACILCVMQSWR